MAWSDFLSPQYQLLKGFIIKERNSSRYGVYPNHAIIVFLDLINSQVFKGKFCSSPFFFHIGFTLFSVNFV